MCKNEVGQGDVEQIGADDVKLGRAMKLMRELQAKANMKKLSHEIMKERRGKPKGDEIEAAEEMLDKKWKPKTAEEHYWEIIEEIKALHRTKGADVGREDDPLANLRASADYGVEPWVHCMIQCDENLRRVQAFIRKGHLEDGDCQIENALVDLPNYGILGLALYREAMGK